MAEEIETQAPEKEYRHERVLVVSAHPDDPEFGFGATVAKLVAEGAEVNYCVCTDGSQGGEDPAVPNEELTRVRYAEQRAAAAVLGVKEVAFLGFRDGHLAPTVELRRAITREIRRFKPDLVLTHPPQRAMNVPIGASHPDHLAVGEAAFAAVYPDSRNPRAYRDLLAEGFEPHRVKEIWVNGFDQADLVIDATPWADRKIEAILCHKSQFEKTDKTEESVKWIRERMRQMGEKHGYELAEGFRRIETP